MIYPETTETTLHCWVWPHEVPRAFCCCSLCPLYNLKAEGMRLLHRRDTGLCPWPWQQKPRAWFVTINIDIWQENRSTIYLLFTQNLFAPWLFFPFFPPLNSPIRSPLGVSIFIMCSIFHRGAMGISWQSVWCERAQIMRSALSLWILMNSALVHGTGVGLVPVPACNWAHRSVTNMQLVDLWSALREFCSSQILIREENEYENDGRKKDVVFELR